MMLNLLLLNDEILAGVLSHDFCLLGALPPQPTPVVTVRRISTDTSRGDITYPSWPLD